MIKQVFSKIETIIKSDSFIMLLCFLVIIPFVVIAYFNQPSGDDFCYIAKAQNLGFWNAQIDWYIGWSGRYLSSAILSLNPLRGENLYIYKLLPVLIIGGLYVSIVNLVSLFFERLIKKDILKVSAVILAVYLSIMPNISEGVYWFAGSITYQLSNIISVFLFYNIIKLLRFNRVKNLGYAIVFTILLMGTNETTMVIVDFVLGSIFFYKSISDKKIHYQLLCIALVALLCSLVVALAPGNFVRGGFFPEKHQLFSSVFNSFKSLIISTIKWSPLLISLVYLFYNYLKKNVIGISSKLLNVNPILVLIVICVFSLFGFFISYWSMGIPPPSRTVNIMCFYYIIGFIYITLIILFKFEMKDKYFVLMNSNIKYFLIVLVFGYLGRVSNVRIVYADLLLGRAYEYDLELTERYKVIQSCQSDICQVLKLSNTPATLFVSDITTDAENWRNECYKSYFSEKEIVIKNLN